MASEILHGFPYLLDFADTQLGLIQKNKVFVQIVVTIENITLGIHTEGNDVIIRVADTGEGISAGEVSKIFDRFYQVEHAETSYADSTGTGIGLALTKGIVELHKGSIKVESEPGKGACFIVTLHLGNEHFDKEQISMNADHTQGQIELPKVEVDALAKAELEENAPNKRLPDVKILIVEDNKSLLETLKLSANILRMR